MITLPLDKNGLPLAALAPQQTTTVALSGSASEVLAADNSSMRIVRLLSNTTNAKVGVGNSANSANSANTHMPLMAGVAEHLKLEAGFALYASGSGTLHITVMG